MKPLLRRTLSILVVALPCIAALSLWARAQPVPAAPPGGVQRAQPPVPVVLAQTRSLSDSVTLDVLGSGLAAQSITVFPAAAGEVAELGFRTGQSVRAGQMLLRLKDTPQRLAVDMAQARLDAARRLLARYVATRGTGAVQGSVMDEAQSAVELAKIELAQAREALADRVVLAPFAGVTGLAAVEVGDRVDTDTAVTTLDNRRSLQVAFALPELYAARVKLGHPVSVTHPAFGAQRFAGRITQIDSRVDAQSRNLRVRAEVPNREDLLRPGMSFAVQLALPGPDYVAVPELALQWGRDGAFVWTVRDGKAHPVRVRSVRRVAEEVLLEGLLQVGDPVVVEGVQRLREGRAVTALTAAADADSAAR